MYLRSTKFKNIFVEIKPNDYECTSEDTKKFTSAIDEDNALILFCGSPDVINDMGGEQYVYMEDAPWCSNIWWDNCMLLCKCYVCGTFDFEFMEYNYMNCPVCGNRCDKDHQDIQRAILTAKQAQFEFNKQ